MSLHDGEALRRLRLAWAVSQTAVAKLAGVSVSHLSRVEAGERPPSPAVLNGYEQALGVRLSTTAPAGAGGDTLGATSPGEDADEMRQRAFTAAIAAIAAGGPLGEPVHPAHRRRPTEGAHPAAR